MVSGSNDNVPALLTVDQTAQLLAVKPRTIWRWLSRKKLPEPVRPGGSTRWRRTDIEAWIAEGCPGRGQRSTMTGRKGPSNGINL